MKNTFLVILVFAVALLISSCSDEPSSPPPPSMPKSTVDAAGNYFVKKGNDNALYGVGSILGSITVPVLSAEGIGISIAANCDGDLYYTNTYEPNLYKMDATGALISTTPLVDASGTPISFGAMSWDKGRQMLWAGTDNSGSPVKVYLLDPGTGIATYQFTAVTGGFGFTDGLGYDGSDNTIWVSDDVSDDIDHFKDDGTYLGSLTPKNAAGGTLGSISGVVVGKGNILYVGRNGAGEIVTVNKSTGAFISVFSTPGGRDEDLECDVVNFPGKEILWSKDAYDNTVTAIEVEPGTCECAGSGISIDIKPQSCPNPVNYWGGGVLPVAVLGTEDFDVSQIDPATVTLEGISPLRWAMGDVSTPYLGALEDCYSCGTDGGDGFTDLTLKFDTQEIVGALGGANHGDCITLTLTGALLDGTPIEGTDIIRIIKRKQPRGKNQD